MMEKRHGSKQMSRYHSKMAQTAAVAERFNQAAIRGEVRPKYQFGDAVADESDLEISSTQIKINGYQNPISIDQENSYSDLC